MIRLNEAITVGLNPIGLCPYKRRRGNLDTEAEMHTGGKSGEHEDRNQGDTSTSHGMPLISSRSSETRIQEWKNSSFIVFRNIKSYRHLHLGLLASRSVT